MKIAKRIYLRLAQSFPHEFKLAYGEEMIQLGEDSIEEISRRHGAAGLISLLADIAIRLPIEYLSEMRDDMRYASRALLKSPGFALVGIVSMGLGIGLTTNVYSSRWAIITRLLPAAANASRIVMPEKPVSYEYIQQYRAQDRLFTGIAAVQTAVPFNVGLPGHTEAKPERVFGQLVSPDYFSVLGVQPQQGRLLSPELDKSGDSPTVVVSDRFWRTRLNSSPDAVGQTLLLNGQNATIVGIAPRGFDGALSISPSELFVPITVPPTLAPELSNDILHQRNARQFLAMICLAHGVTIDSAESALDSITRRLDKLDPSAPPQSDKAKRVVLLPAGTRAPIPRNMRPVIAGFFIVLMGLVMTIACMNLATMLLARGANRCREFAIRLGVGASRFRLVRQMVSEGILISVLGGIAGFALAYGLSILNSQIAHPAGEPLSPDMALDWRAALFTFALSILCGVGFSLAPALQATKADVSTSLKAGAVIQLSGYRRFGLRNLSMVAQLTGSLMLLLITGFLVFGFIGTNSIQTSFDPRSMVLLSIDPIRDGYTPEQAQVFFDKLNQRLNSSGIVSTFALAAQPPFASLDPDDVNIQLTTADTQLPTGNPSSRIQFPVIGETVGPNYFSTLDEPMLAGREFEEHDQLNAPLPEPANAGASDAARNIHPKTANLPVILNQKAARGLFGNNNAMGKIVRDDKHSYEVVGLARDLKGSNGVNLPILYLPLTRHDFAQPPASGITLLVRANSSAGTSAAIRSLVAATDPKVTIFNAQTLSEYFELIRYATRSAARTYGAIGLFGLILSAIGLAGVTAYAVAQRRREIGIRMALGARKSHVLRLVLREGAVLTVVGTILGFLGAFFLARALASVTSTFADAFQIGTSDLRLLIGAPLLLAAVSLLACYLPARRAAQIDPLVALRQE